MSDVVRIDSLTASRSCPPPLDALIAALAARQGGVASRAQLVRLGLTHSGIDTRVARGALHVVHRGVYAVGHPVVNGLGLDHAALLACGPGATRTHRTAGVAWDLRAWSSRTVEVTAARGRVSRPGILVHVHRLDPAEVTVLDGLRTSTLARTVFDLAETLAPEPFKRMWEEGERLELLDLRALRAVCERNPGRHALRVVVPLLGTRALPGTARTRSPLEVDFLEFAAKHLTAFPLPLVNSRVHGFEVDARWPQARFSVELDSRLHHDNDPAFERDRAKWNALVAAGEAVFPLTSRRLRREPELVAAQIAGILFRWWGVGRIDSL